MNKINFAIALHFHQPIGNFDHVIERAFQFCYRPFLEGLSNHPDIKMNFHISGCLFDYLEERHPETIELVRNMVSRNQIEIMGGGYYEPMLPAIPERDVIGQIRMMTDYLERRFNLVPKGMWIPERVWEGPMAELISEAGIRYSILDDTHFFRSGVKQEDMHGYFLTGQGAKKIAVFPSDKRLRYSIPFELPEKTIDYFKEASQGREGLLFTYGDDGEKFGEWPGTHKWVFEDGWLRKFFDVLLQNSEWLRLVKLSDYLENNKENGTIDIKDGSYEEMMEWSNGSWMNFIKKYPETDQMHKKMVYVSEKVSEVHKGIRAKEHKREAEDAKKELYKGQCNCGWWHGVFGGLYLYHLRRAIYNHLINADKEADAVLHKNKKDWLELKKIDFDKDGKDELVLENSIFSLYVDPEEGGVIKELDYRPLSVNLINTLSRKKETYHQKILDGSVKDDGKVRTIHDDIKSQAPGLAEKLRYDKFPRYCLRDYFLKPEIGMKEFAASLYEEAGAFANGAYAIKNKGKTIALERESPELKITKEIRIILEKEIECSYVVEKKRPFDSGLIFGIEFNFTMPDLNSDRYDYFYKDKRSGGLSTKGLAQGVDFFSICDYNKECGIGLRFSESPVEIWYFPVETVSQSERSYELNYQCSCVFPRWVPAFDKNKAWHLKVIWSII